MTNDQVQRVEAEKAGVDSEDPRVEITVRPYKEES